MALPAWLIPALISLIPMLFGGKKDEQTQDTTQDTTQTTVTPPWQPKDPGYNIMSPYLMSMLTQNMGRLSGAGFPGGKGIGGDMTQSIIDLISKSWPDIMGNAGKTAMPTNPIIPDKKTTCEETCKKSLASQLSKSAFDACVSRCLNG
jgi:hypothetical protein